MVHFIPGDPILVMYGRMLDTETYLKLRHLHGFDQPVHVQYFIWLKNIFQGNLGKSVRLNLPVSKLVLERYPRTISLTLFAIIVTVCISLFAGVLSAIKHNTWTDFGITIVSLFGISIPQFLVGIIIMMIFSASLGWFPTSGWCSPWESISGYFKRLFMPGLALGLSVAAVTTRMLRASLLEVLREDYIMLARAKGNPESRVLYLHALRNAMIPVVTLAGVQMGYMLGGTVFIERVFTYPGIGQLVVDSILARDYPVVQGVVLSYAFTFILVNLITDISYAFIDPKIRYGK